LAQAYRKSEGNFEPKKDLLTFLGGSKGKKGKKTGETAPNDRKGLSQGNALENMENRKRGKFPQSQISTHTRLINDLKKKNGEESGGWWGKTPFLAEGLGKKSHVTKRKKMPELHCETRHLLLANELNVRTKVGQTGG